MCGELDYDYLASKFPSSDDAIIMVLLYSVTPGLNKSPELFQCLICFRGWNIGRLLLCGDSGQHARGPGKAPFRFLP